MRKQFSLEEIDLDIINKVKKDFSFRNESETLRYILRRFSKNEQKLNFIADDVYFKFKDDITRLRLGLRTAEQNSIIILDLLNTLLYEYKIDILMPAYSYTTHDLVTKSKERIKEIIEANKQRKDNKNNK